MYNNERVMIDTRKYSVDEMLSRYEEKRILFCNYGKIERNFQEKTKEILEELGKGIPFPIVYASELQRGELLILDKNGKLKNLLTYMQKCLQYRNRKNEFYNYKSRDILYSQIIVYVIDYINPKYMHMQVGKFIEEWQPTQEQIVRNILYKEDDVEKIQWILDEGKKTRTTKLVMQYYFTYFIMAFLFKNGGFYSARCENFDRYQLLEETINRMKRFDNAEWKHIYEKFEKNYLFIEENNFEGNNQKSTEIKMKYLCFSYLCGESDYRTNNFLRDRAFQGGPVELLEQCDMSYNGITKIMTILERGYF